MRREGKLPNPPSDNTQCVALVGAFFAAVYGDEPWFTVVPMNNGMDYYKSVEELYGAYFEPKKSPCPGAIISISKNFYTSGGGASYGHALVVESYDEATGICVVQSTDDLCWPQRRREMPWSDVVAHYGAGNMTMIGPINN